MNKPTLKTIVSRTISIVGPIIISLLCSGILIIPTISLNLDNSSTQEVIVNLKELLLPNINTNNILYSHLGIGLTSIVLLSIINIYKNNTANKFLGITLSMLIIFNIFKYSLNNVLTIFLPLYILVIAEFLKDLFNKTLNHKKIVIPIIIITILIFINNYRINRYTLDILILFISILLYYLTNKKILFIIPLLSFVFISTYTINGDNNLPLKTTYYNEQEIVSNLTNKITYYDQNFYRITNNNNLLTNILLNNKYIITKQPQLIGYHKVLTNNEYYIYRNETTLPIGFSTSNIMSYEDYNFLSNQTKQEALLNVIVADTESNNEFIPSIEKTNIIVEDIFNHSSIKTNKDGLIYINTKETLKIEYKLPKKYKNKILFINFKVNNNQESLSIKINNEIKYLNIANTYQTQEQLEYVLANNNQDKIYISFEPGTYTLSDFQIKILDNANLDNSIKKFDKLIINPIRKKEEILNGKINVLKDGYFMFTFPYQDGFNIKVDNKEIEYEKVDENYIGFPITQGTHQVSISFKSPGKILGTILSIIGLISFIIVVYLERQRKF